MLWDEIRQLVSRGKTVLLTTHYLQEADALADRIAVINQGEIIAEGTPATIKAQTAGKKIRCITSLGISTLFRDSQDEEFAAAIAVGSSAKQNRRSRDSRKMSPAVTASPSGA